MPGRGAEHVDPRADRPDPAEREVGDLEVGDDERLRRSRPGSRPRPRRRSRSRPRRPASRRASCGSSRATGTSSSPRAGVDDADADLVERARPARRDVGSAIVEVLDVMLDEMSGLLSRRGSRAKLIVREPDLAARSSSCSVDLDHDGRAAGVRDPRPGLDRAGSSRRRRRAASGRRSRSSRAARSAPRARRRSRRRASRSAPARTLPSSAQSSGTTGIHARLVPVGRRARTTSRRSRRRWRSGG